jgi:hypothetical protein
MYELEPFSRPLALIVEFVVWWVTVEIEYFYE